MNFEGLIILAVVYFILSAIGKARRRGQDEAAEAHPALRTGADTGQSATQREGSMLEQVLREIERVQREAKAPPPLTPRPTIRRVESVSEAGPLGRHGTAPLEGAEEVEEAGSLEVEEQVDNLDLRAGPRAAREVVDQDDAAEELVRRRILLAQSRNRELGKADHAAFDQRIRQPEPARPAAQVAPQVRAPGLSAEQLRAAFVWKDILGPPRSLHEDDWPSGG